MSHATEGELHAWADGAIASLEPGRAERLATHLRSCADCRTRLEAARGLRERASEILGGAFEGRVEPPPFEAVRARAAAGSSGASGTAPRPAEGRRGGPPLAWAASVLLAIGAGWLGHAVWSGGAPGSRAELASSGPSTGAVAPGGSALVGPPAETAAEDPAATAGDAAAVEGMALRDAPPARSRTRGEAGPEEGRVAAAEREAAPAAADRLARPDPDVPVAGEEASRTAPERQVVDADRPGVDAEGRPPLAAIATTAAAKAEAPVWLLVEPGDAARWLGGGLPRVPDLPVTDVAISHHEGAAIARVGQRLPGGERIEVVVERLAAREEAVGQEALRIPAGARRADDAPPQGEMADERRAKPAGPPLETEVDGFRVRISGPVAADSLRALLSRVR